MSDSVICVEDLGKRYRIGAAQRRPRSSREALWRLAQAPFRHLRRALTRPPEEEILWALRNVSFEVKRGEVVGIIGRNGAGKSTLLKILSRITEPTEGRAELRGRVGSLLEVGVGFNPELTGRENIYLNGAILGMKKTEIGRKFDEIVAFSEVEKFIDTPVKRYSSGMYVRLAFAVAAHLEPEILIVDEVLAVGDAGFQRKCLGKMGDVAKCGRTVLFVSHNMAAVENLCERVILLKDGSISRDCSAHDAIMHYARLIRSHSTISLADRTDRSGNGVLRFKNVRFLTANGNASQTLRTGDDVTIEVDYDSPQSGILRNVSISIPFMNSAGQYLFMCWTRMKGEDFSEVASSGIFRVRLPRLPLMPGLYSLNLYGEVNGFLADWVQEAATLNVISGDFYGTGKLAPSTHGGFLVDHEWEHEGKELGPVFMFSKCIIEASEAPTK